MKSRPLYFIAFGLGLLFCFFVLYFIPFQYKLHKHINLQNYKKQLQVLGRKSIETKDVPVAVLILYNDTIMAEGFNTVYRDTNPAGHAEINAIENCIKKIGFKEFSALDRNKLVLISTFEPCSMCKGAMEEYNIQQCIFDLPKSLKDKTKEMKKEFMFENRMKESGDGRLQYDLFKLHPDFDSTKYRF
jgi:tRNA(Arg) A34 adenosine deaminase TadA